MPNFSTESKQKLLTCHPDIQRIFTAVIKNYDCVILEGARSDYDQQKAFKAGKSKCDGIKIKGKHQVDGKNPLSRAIDVAPFPIDWKDTARFNHFAGFVLGVAAVFGIKIIWGGDWDFDNNLKENKFDDLVHFELEILQD
jgi:peptidoglycan L-alanyl-D-glutamate endopeptidase CwlK